MTADDYMEKAARALSSARLLLADYTGDKIDHEKANWAVDQSAAFIVAIQQEITSRQSESPPNPEAKSA